MSRPFAVAARQTRRLRQSGVSLIEALVALAIMSLGMLALVGVQQTLRFNVEVSRQRVEAARIASKELENMRFFSAQSASQAAQSWENLLDRNANGVVLPGGTQNTTYNLTRTVVTADNLGTPRKFVEVLVTWNDRSSEDRDDPARQVRLSTMITAADPGLGGLLYVAPASSPAFSRRVGRDATIPVQAKDLGDGRSGYKPLGDGSRVVWVFDNATGVVNSICSGVFANQADLSAAVLAAASCESTNARLVSGTVLFDVRDAAPDFNVAQNPTSLSMPLHAATPLRFHDDLNNLYDPVNVTLGDGVTNPNCISVRASQSVRYDCLVAVIDNTGWGGMLLLVPSADEPWTIGNSAGQYKVCRYTTATSDYTANENHPQTYCHVNPSTPTSCSRKVTRNLLNQNFLVIAGNQACPVDTRAISPATGVLANYNTRQHQPVP